MNTLKPKWRYDVLVELLKDKGEITGAEIGVNSGETSEQLLLRLPNLLTLYCVDPWIDYPGGDYFSSPNRNAQLSKNKFIERTTKFGARCITCQMMSEQAAKLVPDKSLFFVFIDGNHQYEYAKLDIQLWLPKIKPGGLLAGHDYANKPYSIGVVKAVDELLGKVEKGSDVTWWKWL